MGREVVMPFCPNCETEYREGFERCSDCGAELVPRLAGEDVTLPEPDAVELTELARFPTTSEADMIRELLERNDIRTVVRGDVDPIGATSWAAPTTLLVENRDLVRARELYETYYAGEETVADRDTSEN
jgi:hypothetical protein